MFQIKLVIWLWAVTGQPEMVAYLKYDFYTIADCQKMLGEAKNFAYDAMRAKNIGQVRSAECVRAHTEPL
jgi:hypothetical protein